MWGTVFNSQGNSDHFLVAVCLEICCEMFFDAKPKFEGEKKLGSLSDACQEGESGNWRTRWRSFANLGKGSCEMFSGIIFITYEMVMTCVLLWTPFLGVFKTQQTAIFFFYRSGSYLSILIYVFLGEEHLS